MHQRVQSCTTDSDLHPSGRMFIHSFIHSFLQTFFTSGNMADAWGTQNLQAVGEKRKTQENKNKTWAFCMFVRCDAGHQVLCRCTWSSREHEEVLVWLPRGRRWQIWERLVPAYSHRTEGLRQWKSRETAEGVSGRGCKATTQKAAQGVG